MTMQTAAVQVLPAIPAPLLMPPADTSHLATVQARALTKLQEIVDAGTARASAGIAALEREYQVRRDRRVQASSVDVEVVDGKVRLLVGGESLGLTDHARGQLLDRALIPARFAETLLDRDLGALLRTNIRELLPKANESVLVRDVDATVKGVLSSSYRRMDASPLFDGFLRACMAAGLVPHQGSITDTRAFLSFIWPEVVDLGGGEYVVLGLELRASDYGRGALEMALVVIRLLCLNGMVGSGLLKKIHLGKRFDGEFDAGGVIELSTRTVSLDLATLKSAVADAVKGARRFRETLTKMLQEKVADTKLDLAVALAGLRKKGMKQELLDRVKATYEAPMPIEALPQLGGAWRLSNTLSLLAHGAKGDEQKDLQDAAWDVALPGRLPQ
jgi:hypothetical protein